MGKKKVTFADIAKYTNFSKTTISRYFNSPDSLTLENQEKIAKALDDLGYQENKLAKVLANGKSEFIGIIIPNLYLHYYSEMLNQLLSSYSDYHYKFLVFVSSDKKELEQQYLDELMAYKIEGLIILSHTFSSEELASYHIPIVAIEREAEHICSVDTDNYMGGVQATSLLAKSGAEILIHINADLSPEVPSYERIHGFLNTCAEQNLPYELILTDTGHSYEESIDVFYRLLDEIDQKYKDKVKGLFLPNDTFANIILNRLFQRYGKLPDDYKIVGFDDSPISRESVIPTSTVGQQIDKIADTALQILSERIKENHKRKPRTFLEPVHKVITPILLKRETTK